MIQKVGFGNFRIGFRFQSGFGSCLNPQLFSPFQKHHQFLEKPRNDPLRFIRILEFHSKSLKSGLTKHVKRYEFMAFRMQNLRINALSYKGLGSLSLWNHRFISSLQEYQDNGYKKRTVPINVMVRSIAFIVHKTDDWDSLLTRLCAVSSSEITPMMAVQVVKRIKKPDLAFKFFKWLEGSNGFCHDSLSYSAILKVLTKDSDLSHAAMADNLLHKKIDLGFYLLPSDFDFVLQQWVRVKKLEKALELLEEMRSRGFVPSPASCNALLGALFKSKLKNLAWDLFHQMHNERTNALDVKTFNIAMKFACVEGRMEDAMELLGVMKQWDFMPNLDTFNILIKGFCEKGDTEMICSLFKQMLDLTIKPDSFTVSLLIKELCKLGRPECGNDVFNYMRRVGWIDKKFVYTQLVDSLCNYGWWLKALKIFVKMVRRGHHPRISLYKNLVRRLCMGGRIREAFKLKDLIAGKGFMKDIENYNTLMDGVCLAGRMDMANKLLSEFHRKGLETDLHMLNTVLLGHCMQGNITEALEIIEMIKQKGWKPDLEPCNYLIASTMKEGKIKEAMRVKKHVSVDQNIDHETYVVMINELIKLDNLRLATELLTEMVVKNLEPDKAIYESVIEGHCREKNTEEACNIYKEMVTRGCTPGEHVLPTLFRAFCSQDIPLKALDLWDDIVTVQRPDVSNLSSAICTLCEDGNLRAAEIILEKMLECNLIPTKQTFEAFLRRLFSQKQININSFLM